MYRLRLFVLRPLCARQSRRPGGAARPGAALLGGRLGGFRFGDEIDAEQAAQFTSAGLGHNDRPAIANALDPPALLTMTGERRAGEAGEMIAPLAPVEAGPAEGAPAAPMRLQI